MSLPSGAEWRSSRAAGLAGALHALHGYGAVAVAAFGWGVGTLLGWEVGVWVPLWLAGALLVYNADRLKGDAADALNVPERRAAVARWRGPGAVVMTLAAGVLLGVPLWRGDGWTLALVLAGTATALAYSLPRRGWRIKDVPVVKSLFAPTGVVLAVATLPLLHGAPWPGAERGAAGLGWAWLYLCANMLLCDGRDVEGDRLTGVRSVPVLLGPAGTRRVLGCLALACGLAAALAARGGAGAAGWWWLAGCSGAIVAGLARAAEAGQRESFYAWWVEGMLFLPGLVALLC